MLPNDLEKLRYIVEKQLDADSSEIDTFLREVQGLSFSSQSEEQSSFVEISFCQIKSKSPIEIEKRSYIFGQTPDKCPTCNREFTKDE